MDKKTTIIETATRLFAHKGFSGTSTAEIAEKAGVAQGTLFYHFKNKQGIIREIFSRAGSIYLAELKKA
ncbi:MAG: TetR/AcrR family transcriptional regulator [Desulfosalsimonas sp.]